MRARSLVSLGFVLALCSGIGAQTISQPPGTGGGGSGCTPPGVAGAILTDDGAGGCNDLASSGTGNAVRVTSPTIAGLTVTGSFTATGLVGNAALVNSATMVNGQVCTLGAACTVTAAATGVTIGSTTVSGGTDKRILFDNAGTLGEYTLSGSGTAVAMSVSPSFTTPTLGVAIGTSLALGGCTIGADTFCATGSGTFSGNIIAANFTGFANPSASLGLAVINGTATTAMRSDSAPALNQAIAPTWSGLHIFSVASASGTAAVDFTGTVFTGGGTTNTKPHVLIEPTGTASTNWANAGTEFGINTVAGFTGNLITAQVAATTIFNVSASGTVTYVGGAFSGVSAGLRYTASSSGTGTSAAYLATDNAGIFGLRNGNTIIGSPATANVRLGATDAASTVAQTLSVQNVVAGNANTAGSDFTIQSSLSNGSGTSDMLFKTTAAVAASGSQNSGITGLVIKGTNQEVRISQIATDAGKTDTTVCQDTTNHGLFSGSGTLGVCLGTSSARYKNDIGPMTRGLADLMTLQPKTFRYLPGYGDGGARLQGGFLAEDVTQTMPELVDLDDQGQPNALDWGALIPIMVRSIQDLQEQVTALKKG